MATINRKILKTKQSLKNLEVKLIAKIKKVIQDYKKKTLMALITENNYF